LTPFSFRNYTLYECKRGFIRSDVLFLEIINTLKNLTTMNLDSTQEDGLKKGGLL
jgi:hypothetical protein